MAKPQTATANKAVILAYNHHRNHIIMSIRTLKETLL